MKARDWLWVVTVNLTVWADLITTGIVWPSHVFSIGVIVAASGIAWAVVSVVCSRRVLWIPVTVSGGHTALCLIGNMLDTRTFFSGAVIPLLAFAAWAIVTLLVGLVTLIRWMALPPTESPRA